MDFTEWSNKRRGATANQSTPKVATTDVGSAHSFEDWSRKKYGTDRVTSTSYKPSTPKVETPVASTTDYASLAKEVRSLESRQKQLKDDYIRTQASIAEGMGTDQTQLTSLRNVETELKRVEQRLKELEATRPEYDTDEAEKRYEAYTKAESDIQKKYGSVDSFVTGIESQYAKIKEQETQLKDLEYQMSKAPSEALYNQYVAAYAAYEANVNHYKEQYADYEVMQKAWDAYDDYDAAARSGANLGDIIGKGAYAGWLQIGQALTSTLAVPERLLGIDGPMSKWADKDKAAVEAAWKDVQEATHGKGKLTEGAAELTATTVAMLPHMLASILSFGMSTAASTATLTTTAYASQAANSATYGLRMLPTLLKTRLKDPSYLTSLVSTFGDEFDTARENGGDLIESLAAALIASAINAEIEVSGGMEKPPEKGSLVKRILKSGNEEGWEEFWQQIVSGSVHKALYDDDKAILSFDDADAVIHPATLVKNYMLGATAGGMMTGVQSGINAGIEAGVKALTRPKQAKAAAVDKKSAETYNKTVSTAAAPEVQQAAAQAENVRTENPESDVLDVGTTLYLGLVTQQGKNSMKKSQEKADVVRRLILGQEVKPREINTLNLTDVRYREVFTKLTGVQFPEGTLHTEQLYNLARSAYTVAQEAKALEVKAEQDLEAARQVAAKAAPEATITLSNGAKITRAQMLQVMQHQYPDASPEQLSALVDHMQAQSNSGNPVPYSKELDPYIKEDNINVQVQEEGQTESGRSVPDAGGLRGLPDESAGQPSGGVEEGAGRTAGADGARGDSRPENRPQPGAESPVRADYEGDGSDGGVKPADSNPLPNQAAAKEFRKSKPAVRKQQLAPDVGAATVVSAKSYTLEMQQMDKRFRKLGFRMKPMMGRVLYKPTKTLADGISLLSERFALVQADSERRSFKQLSLHEYLHCAIYRDDALFDRCWEKAVSAFDGKAERLDSIAGLAYDKSHGKAYSTTEAEERTRLYREELLCDLHGGINDRLNMPEVLFAKLSEAVNSEVAAWEQEHRDASLAETRAARKQDKADKKNSDFIGSRVFSATTELTWEEQLEKMDEWSSNNALYIPETPDILRRVGFPDLALCMTVRHARDVLHPKDPSNADWHGLSMDLVKRLPELLADPVMVMDSWNVPGTVVVVTNESDADGLPIVVPIKPRGSATVDGVRGPANFILTAYGKTNFAPTPRGNSLNNMMYLALRNRAILFWDKEKTEALAKRNGLQLPNTLGKVPSGVILRQYRGSVNAKSPTRMFSTDENDPGEVAKMDAMAQLVQYMEDHFEKDGSPIDEEENIPDWAMEDYVPDDLIGFEDSPFGVDGFDDVDFVEDIAMRARMVDNWDEAFDLITELNNEDKTNMGLECDDYDADTGEYHGTVDLCFYEGDDTYVLVSWDATEEGLGEFIQEFPEMIRKELHHTGTFLDYEYESYAEKMGQNHQVYKGAQPTRTDTPAFKRWFKDDSGELSDFQGDPIVFMHGDPLTGTTEFYEGRTAKSRGLFFTISQPIAEGYASGASVSYSDNPMDTLAFGNNQANREWVPRMYDTWDELKDYIRSVFRSEDGRGFTLVGYDKDGRVSGGPVKTYALETCINTPEVRDAYDSLYRVDADNNLQWETIRTYPATKAGLKEANRELGEFVRQYELGVKAFSKYYLSAKKTFVFDAQMVGWRDLPQDRLPAELRYGHASGEQSINDLAEKAWDAGYDCVIVHNVNDYGGIQTQYIVRDPEQVKSIYNTGSWNKKDRDVRFSTDDEAGGLSLFDKYLNPKTQKARIGGAHGWDEVEQRGSRYYLKSDGTEVYYHNAPGRYGNQFYEDEVDEFMAIPRTYTVVEDEIDEVNKATAAMTETQKLEALRAELARVQENARKEHLAMTKFDQSPVIRKHRTETNTPEFKAWFGEDTLEGENTNPDGSPRSWFHGSPSAGFTGYNLKKARKSTSFFLASTRSAARHYALRAEGLDFDETVDIKEFKPTVLDNWGQAVKFADIDLRLTLEPVGDKYALYQNPEDVEPLFTYDATEEGLRLFNKTYGTFATENPGYYEFYAAPKDPLIFDAKGRGWDTLIYSGVQRRFLTTDDLATYARRAGYDSIYIKNIRDGDASLKDDGFGNKVKVSEPFDELIMFNPLDVKSVYNTGSWSRVNDFRLSSDESPLTNYLKQLEQEFGEGSSQKMFDSLIALNASKQAAKKMVSKESVGAARSGFDPYSHLQLEYGTLEPGENPTRTADVPASTDGRNKVSLTPRTMMEAKAIPENRLETIEQAVVDHKFSYMAGVNKIQANRASARIRKNGWRDALSKWTEDVHNGKVSADLVATGAVLLNNAANSGMSGEEFTQLSVDYADLLRSAAQATQAARILKNLSPTARLYAIERYVDKMNERIREVNPVDNVPVEKWMERTGELLAERLRKKVGGSKKKAKTTAQIILSDLNAFAKTAFPKAEKEKSRTDLERLQDLFNNYENYQEAWDSAKDTIRKMYADDPDALDVFEKFLNTDLGNTFLGSFFKHPEIQIDSAYVSAYLDSQTDTERDEVIDHILRHIAEQIPATKMEMFTALRYVNMLGNLKTQSRNVLGNAFNLGLTASKDIVALGLELGAKNILGMDVERTKSLTYDAETFKAAKADFDNFTSEILSGGKYQEGVNYDERIEEYRKIFPIKPLEAYRVLTNKAMTKGDLVFSKLAYARALAGYLTANNVTFDTVSEDMLDRARQYAIQQAQEATFRDHNAFSDAIAGIRYRNPDTWPKKVINAVAEGILPFRRTPANILVRAVEYSPVGVLTTAIEAVHGKNVAGKVDGAKVLDNLAKNITGSGLMLLGFLLANAGLLKGKGEDDKEKKFNELTGHQDYSIELPNGLSVTLDWLAPSSIPLFLGVQVAEATTDEDLSVRDVATALSRITDPMLAMAMLQGVDEALADASTYGDDSAFVRFTGNSLWNFFTQGLTNTLLGQVERSLSNVRSTTYRDKNKDVPDSLQYLMGKTLEKVPIPGVDYGQIPYIDAWGRMETNAQTNLGNAFNQFLNPAYTSWINESGMEKELRRLKEATGDNSVLIDRPNYYFDVNKQRVDLTGEEYVQYATLRGQTAYNVTTELTESRNYASLSDAQKAKAVAMVYEFATALAKADVTGYSAEDWFDSRTTAPEDAAVPQAWVKEAVEGATEYGISVAEYATAYAATSGLESYKDGEDSVTNSKSLRIAVAIYDLGLGNTQTKKLLEYFDVNKTVRGWNESLCRSKLRAMEAKYG